MVDDVKGTDPDVGIFLACLSGKAEFRPRLLREARHPKLLRAYLRLCKHVTDAPRRYHESVFWTVLATAVGRARWAPLGPLRIFPNLFTVLVGRSSIARKSTCIEIGRRLADGLGVPLLPEDITPEALHRAVAETPRGLMLHPEFSAFLAVARKSYGQGLREFLLKIYDCPDRYVKRTEKDGETVISEPAMSILGAGTITSIAQSMSTIDVTGGLVPRFLWVPFVRQERNLPYPKPLDTVKFAELCAAILDKVAVLELAPCEMALTEGATREQAAFATLLAKYLDAVLPTAGRSVAARMCVSAVKIAILAAVVNGHEKVNAWDMEVGAVTATYCLASPSTLQKLTKAGGTEAQLTMQVEDLLVTQGVLSRSELLSALYPHVNARKLDKIMATLVEADKVEKYKDQRDPHTAGRLPTMYRWIAEEEDEQSEE